ncbi:hypothetical protein FD724_38325 (plasmid) [Nostoc sp. C057]|uniref:hypothetical protein n=1 Tax=Nostoc sp. C057 TaxID=2576903 RepID=UPI0015C39B16|nr:hypothetical protein [Nostoc sp. C057]QLE53715.1 hypothetical protein FD724_38325 [Nostoc sp. C057]
MPVTLFISDETGKKNRETVAISVCTDVLLNVLTGRSGITQQWRRSRKQFYTHFPKRQQYSVEDNQHPAGLLILGEHTTSAMANTNSSAPAVSNIARRSPYSCTVDTDRFSTIHLRPAAAMTTGFRENN